jgi:hypothetical protein
MPPPPTTVKLSRETRERLRGYGDTTAEATIVRALDALDRSDFWAQAESALAARALQPLAIRLAHERAEAELDRLLDQLG